MKSVFDFWRDFCQNGQDRDLKKTLDNRDCPAKIGTYGKSVLFQKTLPGPLKTFARATGRTPCSNSLTYLILIRLIFSLNFFFRVLNLI